MTDPVLDFPILPDRPPVAHPDPDIGGGAVRKKEFLTARCQVTAIVSGDTVLGLLHVGGHNLNVQIVEAFADALGSMVGLLGMRRRAEEQRHVLARLWRGLAETGEPPIELFDAAPDPRAVLIAT
ncbi:hypothetical protein [Mycobacterium sp. OTB74]|uniref:hypothetical protein n=1 Tax=Mycobacterium sp. OTB74 TaxID=1853452 RepID=UPI002475F1B1|nr:hypothetical protein [Mycobacterium sp. OTB74]MDH6245075.1 hypothetical protein [Mycobacterium sp. OTB74]